MENKEQNYYVYFHKNPITLEVFYVGIGVRYRYKEIKTNRNQHYLNYVNKNGYPIIEIIHKNISFKEACELEIKYIKQFGRKGYEINGTLVNKGLGGEIGARGTKHTEEWKNNHRIIMTKFFGSIEYREKMSKLHKGKIVSKEVVQKIMEKRNNKEIGLKIKETFSQPEMKIKRGKAISEGRKKPVIQYDLQNNIINKFKSAKDAKEITSIKGIGNVLIGTSKTAGGYFWKYES